ncbi:acyl-CoA thioesterase [Sinirhodobacter populi]|uniref:Acyl-CoA thioesterase n=2 Tax=Paenirhodobacter populi TaxID=2306993 RepID=A0A443K5B3_9RHOB|nr:acyl-CoA thioesterase [Sinirhodobacter populi]
MTDIGFQEADMTEAFQWQRRVGFGDCDPAGIAYTGTLSNLALEALDVFWEEMLDGKGWYRMNTEYGFGMPFVHMEMDFKAPVIPGTPLVFSVAPEAVGRSSVRLHLSAEQGGVLRFTASFVSVFVTTPGMEKIPVPEIVRAALARRFGPDAGI